MKRKAKELQAARIASGKSRSLLGGFGNGQGGGTGPGNYPTRQDNAPSVGDVATPVETSTSKSYPSRYRFVLFLVYFFIQKYLLLFIS